MVRLILNLYLSLNPLPNLNLNHNPNRSPKTPQAEGAFLVWNLPKRFWLAVTVWAGMRFYFFNAADAWGAEYVPPCNPPEIRLSSVTFGDSLEAERQMRGWTYNFAISIDGYLTYAVLCQ